VQEQVMQLAELKTAEPEEFNNISKFIKKASDFIWGFCFL
jgi:hypothetical protein